MVKLLSLDNISRILNVDKNSFSKEWKEEDYRKLNENYSLTIYTFEEGNNTIGFAVLMDSFDVIELVRVAVLKEYRNKGIACKIIEEATREISKNIILEVREKNEPAINLYKKIGFKEISRRKSYYKDTGEDAIIMLMEK